ncbi:hypothetical protein GQ55_7G112600 [Panicum hallii var. hallii]|uniref:Uncharacterized protein n=1 Tax=Panicum hallii var. hallii TaxID=1504633 RepID=A0A2T7CU07_9POAL|nr:hypothetical protein GQ55_7G112600 [Panicum hallii var. hallii]
MAYEVLHPCSLLTSSHMKIFLLCFLLLIGLDLALFSATPDHDQLLYLAFTGTILTVDDTTTVTSILPNCQSYLRRARNLNQYFWKLSYQ